MNADECTMGAWTRVGERLPKYGVQVLAWTGDGGYPVIAYLRCDEHGEFWEGFHNGEKIAPACVTLWTPMPSPPPFEQNTQDQPLTVSFEIPDRMPPDIQMMAVWSQVWSMFGRRYEPHEQFAALSWFGAWTKAQMERHRQNQNP